MTENKKLESEDIFLNTENFSQFILKYKNHFEKRKYFQLGKNFKITTKEPSFILELGYIYFSENEKNEKNENIKQIISKQFLETFKEKDKKIERLSKVELPKLIDGFRRSIFNKESIYAVKLGNELLYRDKDKFFEILYNYSLISTDTNKLVKTFFAKKMIEKIETENGSKFNEIRDKIDEIIKNIINYFTKSDSAFLNFENVENLNYFVENQADELYKKIYVENYDKIVEKYNIQNVKKIEFSKNYDFENLSESKKILYKYI
ncbi:hypothetical protein [Leptotrichia buccalis]|uniref:Uncharacterized protein n=1 Tax=Leptotrichia buccalis (strain ATCC 14201 / DSM 1135 / JCM 12969 / NCTC 10249 / C-1013-b) TaxID=523794 RepID=C7NDU0_LEPBD|nr:hypothetical protein [Leptotrichia buccalis]ACV40054.1 hypothetical protein Lebu_2201 [Leptotrichia buccalis C-1013-b]